MTPLELRFHRPVLDLGDIAERELGYRPNIFRRVIQDHGGVTAAPMDVLRGDPTYGFNTLYMHGRLDLAAEAYMLKPEFADLFTEKQKRIARSRLKEFGYKGD